MTNLNAIRFVGVVTATVCLDGCASGRLTLATKSTGAEQVFVRKVDYSQTPELKELAERAGRIGNEMYPKVLAVLADDTSKLPQQFDIVFKKHLQPNQMGRTLGTKICLDTGWLAKNPGHLEIILIHEMAHLPQAPKWYRAISSKSWCWMEGMADYVPYKLGYTNGWRCPQCSAEFPHYTYGYTCAGAFLLFLDATYGSSVVRQLNTELRRRTYSEKFFASATGKSLAELWVQFQKTPAFTPAAVEVDKLYNALGYMNGKPPKNVQARFKAYLRQQGETANFDLRRDHAHVKAYVKQQGETNEPNHMSVEINGNLANDILRLYALHRYFQEAAKAAEFLGNLWDKDQLPGFSQRGVGGISFRTDIPVGECESWAYPMSRTISCTMSGNPATFHYVVVQPSKDSPWQLQKAWRTAPDGSVIEEYPVP